MNDNPTQDPPSKLRALRLARFLTQAELAAAAGLTTGTLARAEREPHRAELRTLRKLAGALGVTPEALR